MEKAEESVELNKAGGRKATFTPPYRFDSYFALMEYENKLVYIAVGAIIASILLSVIRVLSMYK